MNETESPVEVPLDITSATNKAEGSGSKCKKCGCNISLQPPTNNGCDSSQEQKIDIEVDVIGSLVQTSLTSRPVSEQCHIVFCLGRPPKLTELNKEVETWCSDYKWVCSSPTQRKLFCWPCVLVGTEKNIWCETGFEDFPNFAESAVTHEESKNHIESLFRFMELKVELENCSEYDATSEDDEENAPSAKVAKYDETVSLNRRLMQIIIDTVLCAVEHETTYSEKVLKCLLELVMLLGSEQVVNRFEQFKRLFPGDMSAVQDELVEYINEYIEEYVKNELKAADMFAVRLDSYNVIVRFVKADGQLVERFLGFHFRKLAGSWGIYHLLQTVLEPSNYKDKLVAQCYDSSSIYGAYLDEIQRKMKEESPQAVFAYCVEHRLSLILEQNFERSFDSYFLSQFRGIFDLKFYLQQYMPEWPSETENMFKVVADQWDSLENCFANHESDRYEYDISRFQESMQNFNFVFLTCTLAEIFEVINALYHVLKEESLNIPACLEQIQKTCQTLKEMKQEENCQRLLEWAKTKRRIDELDNEESDKHKQLYFNILDTFSLELHVRFQDLSKLEFVALTDSSKFEEYSSNFPSHLLPSLRGFPKIFPRMERLKNELAVFYTDTIYYDATVEAVIQDLQIYNIYKDVFPEVYKLFCLVAILPSTYIESTSSFLRDIKTCARYPSEEDDVNRNKYWTQHIGIQGQLLRDLGDDEKETFYDKVIDKFAALGGAVFKLN